MRTPDRSLCGTAGADSPDSSTMTASGATIRRRRFAIRRLLVIAVGVGLVAGVAAALSYGRWWGPGYSNPVVRHDAPDPSIIRADDGYFYAYTTQSDWPTLENIPVLRSKDLLHWRHVSDALPRKPRWVTTDIWAPHIVRIEGRYTLYFSARQFGSAGFAIGVATSSDPAGPFTGEPEPLLRGPGFTTIDPFVLTTPRGPSYIYWGSDGAPIRVQRLTSDGRRVVGEPRALLYPSGREYEGLLEGSWVLRRNGFYYLMYSGDACCEPEPHYAVMVARSRSPVGPFRRDADNPILAANDNFYGPGHNATIRDAGGRDWILYHAFERGEITAQRFMLIDPIDWENGWPVINHGEGPSSSQNVVPQL